MHLYTSSDDWSVLIRPSSVTQQIAYLHLPTLFKINYSNSHSDGLIQMPKHLHLTPSEVLWGILNLHMEPPAMAQELSGTHALGDAAVDMAS